MEKNNFTIPIAFYSEVLVEFHARIQALNKDHTMIKEHIVVNTQFIPPYFVPPTKEETVILIQDKNQKIIPKMTKAKVAYFFSYYGEKVCTEQEYTEWALQNQPKP